MSPRARYSLFAVLALVAVVCVRLGFWQLDRLQERRERNARLLAARAAPVVDLTGGVTDTTALAYRRVRITGRYDSAHDLILRGQVYREVPGVHVVTPLRPVEGDTAFLVNRGFVPAPDAATANTDSLRESGLVEVAGIARPLTAAPDSGRPLAIDGRATWRRLDLDALRARLPYPIAPIVIAQTPDSALPRFPRRLEPAALDDGPHLSYAIQWFAFATIALVVGGVVVVKGTGSR